MGVPLRVLCVHAAMADCRWARRAEARFAHPDAQDLVGYEAEASRKAADGFHPFTPHAFSPAPQLAQQSIGPQGKTRVDWLG